VECSIVNGHDVISATDARWIQHDISDGF